MTIVGVGTDVVEVTRIRHLIDRGGPRFLRRWFRPAEVEFCLGRADGARHAAALLAAKEAAWKSLPAQATGAAPWRDIEIVHRTGQRPQLRLHGPAKGRAASAGVSTFHVSLSHTADVAAATVVATSDEGHDST